jgi:hypothetical protein
MNIIGTLILGFVLFIGIPFVAQGTEFYLYKIFAPKYEDVRRETFEHSKAYNQGMVQEIQNMQFEYEKTDDGHKAALASIILHRVADYDLEKLPPDTKEFIEKLKRGDK